MDNETIKQVKKKQKYNKFVFKITQYSLQNCKPPENLIKMAKELGLQIGIPEAELKNIRSSIL